ncbi:MAG: hypothetical protein R3248_11285 [Candidatus Promineifilaceae bacterium]|nr:hypothetical protein [Candidatus Promineifilaceae bacterium]
MMEASRRNMHQVMDWQAAIMAGLFAGAMTLLVLLVAYPLATGGTPWTALRFIAAIVLGSAVLPPPTTFDAMVALTGVTIHLALSVLYAVVLALIIHRWGIIIGFLCGALFGGALFLINLFAFTNLFDWFYPLRSWPFLALHLFFGAVAGGVYELLERDYYVESVTEEWT